MTVTPRKNIQQAVFLVEQFCVLHNGGMIRSTNDLLNKDNSPLKNKTYL